MQNHLKGISDRLAITKKRCRLANSSKGSKQGMGYVGYLINTFLFWLEKAEKKDLASVM
jgi:hypothetical protein